MARRHILIAGCGYVGLRLAELRAQAGDRVFALRRSGGLRLPHGVEGVRADLSQIATLASLPTGIDAVVYCAGAGRADPDTYRRVYLDGPGNLLRALREAGERPRRFLFCSSTAVYGQSRGEWVDETSHVQPGRWNGETMLAAERLVAASLPRAGRVPGATLVRLGGIYGPGRTRLVEQVRSGRARLPAAPHYTNRIHRDDAAGVLSHLLDIEPAHDVYLGVDDEPADLADVLRHLAKRLGVPEPPAEAEPEAGAGSPAAPRRAGSKRCRNARIRAEGYRFRYPSFREGYATLARPGGE